MEKARVGGLINDIDRITREMEDLTRKNDRLEVVKKSR